MGDCPYLSKDARQVAVGVVAALVNRRGRVLVHRSICAGRWVHGVVARREITIGVSDDGGSARGGVVAHGLLHHVVQTFYDNSQLHVDVVFLSNLRDAHLARIRETF